MLVNTVCPANKPKVILLDLWTNKTPKIETTINELKNNNKGISPSIMYNNGNENNTF